VSDDKTIRITCDPDMKQDRVPLDQLEDFQGDLKALSDAAQAGLTANLLDLGYSYPTCVWHGHKAILDGHQRNRVLRALLEDGYALLDVDGEPTDCVPVTWVMAATEKEARKKVLAAVSQYGKVSDAGLQAFLGASDLEWPEVKPWVDLPDFDVEAFEVDFYGDVPVAEDPDLSDGEVRSGEVILQLTGAGEAFTSGFVDELHKLCQRASITVRGIDKLMARPKRRYWGSWKKGDVQQPDEPSLDDGEEA